jgi:Protein of unknown function (DUF2934)
LTFVKLWQHRGRRLFLSNDNACQQCEEFPMNLRSVLRAPRARRAAAPLVTPEQRESLIAEAAYYLAEQRGFAPGAELDDWLEAEREIEQMLSELEGAVEEEE